MLVWLFKGLTHGMVTAGERRNKIPHTWHIRECYFGEAVIMFDCLILMRLDPWL